MPKCFIVFGPSSSGTRFVTRLFTEAGCKGSSGFKQDFDTSLPEPALDMIVWKTHNSGLKDELTVPISQCVSRAKKAGYDPVILLINRDIEVLLDSRAQHGYATNRELDRQTLLEWYGLAWKFLSKCSVPYFVISYDALVQYKEPYVDRLSALLGIKLNAYFIFDANMQHLKVVSNQDAYSYRLTSVQHRGIPFFVREGTVDNNVLEEVIDGDCYQLDHITLRQSANIVDVGAHIGGFSKLSTWKWPYATVYAYEANPYNWGVLEYNLAEVRHKVTLFKGALVGKEPVNKRLVIKGDEAKRITGGWGIIYAPDSYEPTAGDAVVDIDKFFYVRDLWNQLDKIDILKLDCEGSEWSILWNMTKEELYKVDYLVAEIHCGALDHAPCSYEQMRARILDMFICPQLEARPTVSNVDLFNIVACNRKLAP